MSELYEKESLEHMLIIQTENACVMCGAIIPEGRMVCSQCTLAVEHGETVSPWNIVKNNTPGEKRSQRLFGKNS